MHGPWAHGDDGLRLHTVQHGPYIVEITFLERPASIVVVLHGESIVEIKSPPAVVLAVPRRVDHRGAADTHERTSERTSERPIRDGRSCLAAAHDQCLLAANSGAGDDHHHPLLGRQHYATSVLNRDHDRKWLSDHELGVNRDPEFRLQCTNGSKT
jgi:hypothetical protein